MQTTVAKAIPFIPKITRKAGSLLGLNWLFSQEGPIVFNLGDWFGDELELEDWMTDDMKEQIKKQNQRLKGREIKQLPNVYITVFAASIYAYLNFIAVN